MTVVLAELKSALKERIGEKKWLDDHTMHRALLKADRINEFLAYPAEIADAEFLDTFYTKVCTS